MSELKAHHKRHPKDNWVDFSEIVTEPRWKTSELSGDEWRFSYHVYLYRKGWRIAEKSFNRADYAATWLTQQLMVACPAEQPWPEQAPPHYGDGYFCDNPGCPNIATVRGDLKQVLTRQGEGPLDSSLSYYRVFCDDHKRRGDCSREDSDSNYEWSRLDSVSGE